MPLRVAPTMAPCWMVMPMVPAFTKTPKEVKPWGLKRKIYPAGTRIFASTVQSSKPRSSFFYSCLKYSTFSDPYLGWWWWSSGTHIFERGWCQQPAVCFPSLFFLKKYQPSRLPVLRKCLGWLGPRLINIVMRGSITSEQWYGNTCSHEPVQTYSLVL